jgi:prevent-host-death family protein
MYSDPVASEFVTVARLRAEMAGLFARLDRDGPLYVTQRGQARAVLMDVDRYRLLIEQLEYLDDALEALLARERRERGEETARPLADVIRERHSPPTGRPKTATARRAHARISR